MNIQETLKKINEKLTDKEVSDVVNLSPNTIARLRRGVHKSTRYEYAFAIKQLAENLGIQP